MKENLLVASRQLRKNMTKQEKQLWYCFLKNYPVRIHRQKVIDRFIVDFYCAKAKLVIELDGSQHYTQEGITRDNERTAYLNALGLKILRFKNLEIDINFEQVCNIISKEISSTSA